MANQVIEGTWDEIVQRHDLRGRKVRVIVVDEPATTAPDRAQNTWVEQLHAWADSHAPVSHVVDDSRESIYRGTVDDPR